MAAPLKRGLEEGHTVDVASSGPDRLWFALEFAYDVILLDVMLPGLSGVEICRRLREERRWTPVLMLPARDAVQDRIRGLARTTTWSSRSRPTSWRPGSGR
jgi:two-component system OmpR family response regulator